jgi:hypothetical protein
LFDVAETFDGARRTARQSLEALWGSLKMLTLPQVLL